MDQHKTIAANRGTGPANALWLPGEVWELVFSMLPTQDRIALALTGKQFGDRVAGTRFKLDAPLWKLALQSLRLQRMSPTFHGVQNFRFGIGSADGRSVLLERRPIFPDQRQAFEWIDFQAVPRTSVAHDFHIGASDILIQMGDGFLIFEGDGNRVRFLEKSRETEIEKPPELNHIKITRAFPVVGTPENHPQFCLQVNNTIYVCEWQSRPGEERSFVVACQVDLKVSDGHRIVKVQANREIIALWIADGNNLSAVKIKIINYSSNVPVNVVTWNSSEAILFSNTIAVRSPRGVTWVDNSGQIRTRIPFDKKIYSMVGGVDLGPLGKTALFNTDVGLVAFFDTGTHSAVLPITLERDRYPSWASSAPGRLVWSSGQHSGMVLDFTQSGPRPRRIAPDPEPVPVWRRPPDRRMAALVGLVPGLVSGGSVSLTLIFGTNLLANLSLVETMFGALSLIGGAAGIGSAIGVLAQHIWWRCRG